MVWFYFLERLQRLDETIRTQIAEKQKIICDMFKVPDEHFNAIADIAGQPEASKVNFTIGHRLDSLGLARQYLLSICFRSQDPTETMLAAFAQVQSLTEALNEYINVPLRHDLTSMPATALCDDCHRTRELQTPFGNSNSSRSSTTVTTVVRNTDEPPSDATSLMQDDDGYCEIDEIRMPMPYRVSKKQSKKSSKRSSSSEAAATGASDDAAESESKATTDNTDDTFPNADDAIDKANATTSDDPQPSLGSSENNHEHVATTPVANDVNEHTSTPQLNATKDETSNANAFDGNLVENPDEHIEINDAYDTVSQRNADDAKANAKADADALIERVDCASESCPRKNSVLPSLPLIPCHLITTYVSALNQHISLLLVSKAIATFS